LLLAVWLSQIQVEFQLCVKFLFRRGSVTFGLANVIKVKCFYHILVAKLYVYTSVNSMVVVICVLVNI